MQINVVLPPGSSLEASNRGAAASIDAKFRRCRSRRTNPDGEILHFARRTGRAELDEHAEPVNDSEYILTHEPDCGKTREEILSDAARRICRRRCPAWTSRPSSRSPHLISHMLSGVNAQIAIKVYGDDLDSSAPAGRARSRRRSPTCRA